MTGGRTADVLAAQQAAAGYVLALIPNEASALLFCARWVAADL
jgi:hypothetical protein